MDERGGLVALAVAGPLLALPASFIGQGDAFDQIASSLLGEALSASVALAAGVGAGTLVLGGGLAVLISFFDFPGRRWLDWALVLPLAIPGYVLVFVLLGQYDEASALQEALRAVFGDGAGLPDVRTTRGRSSSSRSSCTRTSTCSAAAPSSASPARRSRPRARWDSPTARRCAGSLCRSPGRRWRPGSRWR